MQEVVNGFFCLVLFHSNHGDQSLNFGYVEFKISTVYCKWIYQERNWICGIKVQGEQSGLEM